MSPLILAGVAAAISIGYAVALAFRTLSASAGSEDAQQIAAAIQEGSVAFLTRQYRKVSIVAAILTLIIGASPLGWPAAFGFITGAVASAVAGVAGMYIAVRANVRVAHAAGSGLPAAFSLAYRGGAVTGFAVVGLALAAIVFIASAFGTDDLTPLIALSFGGSLISVFARLGGGIFTKAADVGADLVGKLEAGIPEDDPRNPAVIADNVGDNVGDDAGMAADIFETYVVTLTAALLLGFLAIGSGAITFSFSLASVAILASIVASFFVRLNPKEGPERIMRALYKGLISAIVISAVLFYPLAKFYFAQNYLGVYLSALIGLAVTLLMVFITDYYTAKHFRPVRAIAEASASGHGTNIIMGLAVGMESTFLPIIVITAGILLSFWLAGLFGIAVAALSMLSVAGVVVAIDSFGPITDNAGGIAEMTNQPKEVREITDALDAVGNTTKAVTKGYAIASAGLAALVDEVRRQFREIKGIMEGQAKPDYSRAVDIVTKAALKQMIVPSLVPIAAALAVGF